MAFGNNEVGQTNILDLPEGLQHVGFAAGSGHTVLLMSDGSAVAFGYNRFGNHGGQRIGVGGKSTHQRLSHALHVFSRQLPGLVLPR